jgi:hypothetical protein
MYRISWSDNAIDGLADLALIHQAHWADINSAVELIEYRLQRFPMVYGSEISEGLWRIAVEPISITFTMVGRDITVESIGWTG